MTKREYPGGDRQSYGETNNTNNANNNYYPYPQSGPASNYNYNPANQYPPAASEYPHPHSPYQPQLQPQSQPQPWGGPSQPPSNFYSQPGGQPYQNAPYAGQPPYESPRPNPTESYPPQPYPPSFQQPGYGQHSPVPPPYSPHPTDTPNVGTEEKDRGFLGAVAGGAAGAYGGHKVNHGILGAIGGAMTGSVAQDAMKKHKEKKEEEEKKKKWAAAQQAAQAQHHAPPPHFGAPLPNNHHLPGPTPMRGNFSASARDIRLEGNHDLVAHCCAISGQFRPSVIPLNTVLSNHFGTFAWERNGNFSGSARNVRLIEGGKVVEAELANGQGGWNRAWMRLDERISNQNGTLVFLD
ncbi:CVNH domain-containing protein [Aspergillus coremiiformis]|uniref:CVNH domain-containing protein n=1 Tax=Aspergillus coremiiformis TaxID=138285 RepID=A0A5N6Z339_9EURO|nr:CVNH domain-containing protein [Aspergillus coremiiformis]